MTQGFAEDGRQHLDRSGIAVVVGTFFAAFVEGALLFAAAGTLALPRAWFFLALSFVAIFGQIALVAWKNPELVNHRGRWRKKKDAKPWDKPLVFTFGILGFHVLPIVIRTHLEDRTLCRELPGYPDYAAQTPNRLLPGIWQGDIHL